MKIIRIFFLLCVMLFAEPQKVYFYTSTNVINDFKTFKILFDRYLAQYGDYEFQAFSDKKSFEYFLKYKHEIVLLSSSHYRQLSKKYHLDALLVAKNKKSVTSTNVIVGKRNSSLNGTITTAFSKKYTNKLVLSIFGRQHFSVLKVPKDMDALLSVGYGMSQFAAVSKESFEFLKKTNQFLTKEMRIYRESDPDFKMLVTVNPTLNEKKKVVKMFRQMRKSKDGQRILKMLDIDNIVALDRRQLRTLRSLR